MSATPVGEPARDDGSTRPPSARLPSTRPPSARPPSAREPTWLERHTTPDWLLGGAAVVYAVFWFVGWRYFGGRNPLHANKGVTLAAFGPEEAPFFITAFLFEGILIAWLARVLGARWPKHLDERWRELLQKPRTAYIAFACLAGAGALIVGIGVLRAHPITEDEKTYLFQSHLLLHGRLSIPVPEGARAFWQPFVVGPSPGRWSGQYTWGQPAALLPGVIVGCAWIVPPIEAALTVFFTGKLAEEYTDDARVGVLAAALAALSPIVVLTAGTLYNVNLAAVCTSASLWAIARLAKRSTTHRAAPWRAWITLGVATGVGLHSRAMDQAVMIAGAAVLVVARFKGDARGLARTFGPAVAISAPLIALMLVLNQAAYGSWATTGYALFNRGHDWITMGFGTGPFGTPHTVELALAKTITAFVRVAFYATGSPLAFCLLAAPFLGLRPRGLASLAPIVPVLAITAGYFFYAGSSIDSTGPVYYLPLMPLLLAWTATCAVDLHEALRSREHALALSSTPTLRPRLSRAVPAFLCAQALAAAVVFWPAQIAHLARDGEQASDCETLIENAEITRGLVFVVIAPAATERLPDGSFVPMIPVNTWHRRPPFSEPPFDAPILWARPRTFEEDALAVDRFAGDRTVYLASCFNQPHSVFRYDPKRRVIMSLDGKSEREISRPEDASSPPGADEP